MSEEISKRGHLVSQIHKPDKLIPAFALALQAAIALAERAAWCQEYARTNAQSLRKIAKKHDKVSH